MIINVGNCENAYLELTEEQIKSSTSIKINTDNKIMLYKSFYLVNNQILLIPEEDLINPQ